MKFLLKNKYLLLLLFGILTISAWILFHVFNGLKENSFAPFQASQQSHLIGSAACKECHEIEFGAWKKSDHYKSMQVADEETMLGDFNNSTFKSKGFTNKMFQNDSAFLIVLEGLLYQQQNQALKAENASLEGLKNNPDNERLLYAIAHFYLQEGNHRQARQFARRLVSRFPNRPEYLELLRMTE